MIRPNTLLFQSSFTSALNLSLQGLVCDCAERVIDAEIIDYMSVVRVVHVLSLIQEYSSITDL